MRFLLALATATMLAPAAHAHEYVVKPSVLRVSAGRSVPVEAVSSHVFITSQELEDARDSLAGVWAEGKRTPIVLQPDEAAKVHRGTMQAAGEGCFLVTGHRAGQVWSSTPQGTRRVGREAPGATNIRMVEKFSKTVVNASAGDAGCLRPIGDKLEVVTLTNPADATPGQDITVQVLLDGKPLTTPVYATYDGFSQEENTYTYYTEGRPDGTARVRITQPGVWMVRAEYSGIERNAAYDRYVGRAVLVFEVK